jgi:SSS family solute:Na+ symporter
VTQASLIVTAAFAIYTMMGGLWAVVWTDALQYVVLMAGIIIAVILALKAVGGVDGLHTSLPGEYFSFTQLGLWTPLAWGALALYSYGVDQAYMQRALAAKDPETARFAYLFTAGNYVVFGACVALLGLAAAVLIPGLENENQAVPELVAQARRCPRAGHYGYHRGDHVNILVIPCGGLFTCGAGSVRADVWPGCR